MNSSDDSYRGLARGRLLAKLVSACSALALLAACSSPHRQASYAGEDTAYYLAHARGNYNPPGPPSDPWGPYIRIAAARFDVPQMWIRQVMRVESGGHEYSNGQLIVSDAGAMGLMQLEPGTYREMAARYGLDNDPFNPLDNIMAGAAYIHEMYQIYGCPGFLAAYNAGPGRLDSYINNRRPLPQQTVNYVAMIAPNIDGYYPHHRSSADELALNTNRMGYDGGILPRGFAPEAPTAAELSAPVQIASLSPTQAAYAGDSGPVTVPVSSVLPQAAQIEAAAAARAAAPPAAALQTGSLPAPATRVASNSALTYTPPQPVAQPMPVERPAQTLMARANIPSVPHPPYNVPQPTYSAPQPTRVAYAAPKLVPPPAAPTYSHRQGFSLVPSAMAETPADAGFNSGKHSWGIQVGAFDTSSNARAALGMAELSGSHALQKAEPVVMRVSLHGGTIYRARFVGMQHEEAVNACSHLSGGPTGCVILPPDERP